MDIKSKEIKIDTKFKAKNRVVICNSYNTGLNHLNIRYPSYTHIPHYTVLRDGQVYKHLEDTQCPDYLTDDSLIVALENWGELKEANKHLYSIYSDGDIMEREWRGFKYFHRYTDAQIEKTSLLCRYLLGEHRMSMECQHNNILIKNINDVRGVCYRANFEKHFLDVSPAFPFESFKKSING